MKKSSTVLVIIAVIIGSYIVRRMVIAQLRMAFLRQQAIIAAQRKAAADKARAKATKPPTPSSPGEPVAPKARGGTRTPVPPRVPVKPTPSPYARLSGVWRGRAAIDGRGICDVRFELSERPDAQGQFTGYAQMVCLPTPALVAQKRPDPRVRALNQLNPEAAILSGAVREGTIELSVDKTVNSDSSGCNASSYSLTPFGNNQLAAEWREEGCAGGRMILRRGR